ncbi:MAG: hypothetical protein WC510_04800 [Candidatus Omnitrophota bacterium]
MELIHKYKDIIVSRLGGNLEALILVGSFSRNEGLIKQSNGKLELISDIEYWAVMSGRKVTRHTSHVEIERELKDYLKKQNIEVDIAIKVTTKEHLRMLKPYIFTIETKKYGKVLWGDEKILDYIPDYTERDIVPLDGFILLNNRIVEQLIVWQKASSGQPTRYYDIVKGYIQLVNSYLAVNKTYKCLYPEKQEEFHRTYNGNSYLKDRVNQAFAFLKQPENIILAQDDALKQWQELRDYYRQMWEQQLHIFVKTPSFIQGIKWWIKILVDSRKRSLFSFIEIFTNLFITSPQFLIYRYAAREYFSDNSNAFKINWIIKQWETIVK